eukprot:scaffold827_cov369-Prasinococcus_capsulatus_cf.AAC.3
MPSSTSALSTDSSFHGRTIASTLTKLEAGALAASLAAAAGMRGPRGAARATPQHERGTHSGLHRLASPAF